MEYLETNFKNRFIKHWWILVSIASRWHYLITTFCCKLYNALIRRTWLPSTFHELSNTNREYYFSWLFLRMDWNWYHELSYFQHFDFLNSVLFGMKFLRKNHEGNAQFFLNKLMFSFCQVFFTGYWMKKWPLRRLHCDDN